MDAIEKVNKEIIAKITPLNLSNEIVNEIELAIFSVLYNYKIEIKTNDLVVYNAQESINILKMFIASKRIEGLTKRTLEFYWHENLKFLSAANKPLEEIVTNDVRLYLANQQCGNVTKNNMLRCISAFFGWCVIEEHLQRNPTLRIKQIKTPKKTRKPFTDIEVEKIRNGAETLRDKALIEVLLSTGCRVSEIVGMDRENIKNNKITVIGKGNKERIVYLNAKARYAIEKYLTQRTDNSKALFVSLIKPYQRLKASGIEIIVRKIGEKSGVEKAHPHRFRHTYATMALQNGIPVEHVQRLLGHENLDTTMIYAEVNSKETQFLYEKYMNTI